MHCVKAYFLMCNHVINLVSHFLPWEYFLVMLFYLYALIEVWSRISNHVIICMQDVHLVQQSPNLQKSSAASHQPTSL